MTSNIIRRSQLNSNKNRSKELRCSDARQSESLLGNTTEFASTPVNTGIEQSLSSKIKKNENRYALQKIAKKYHPESRLSSCMKTILPTKAEVELHYDDSEQHAHYRNLMRCDDVWKCPVCSARMTSRRAEDIRQAYAYAVDILGWRVVMVTYTLRHSRFDDLETVVKSMREARRKMRSGRRWQEFKANYGYEGCISSLESPHGENNGWHPHVHELMFLNPEKAEYELHEKDSVIESWLDADLSGWWVDSLKKVGRSATDTNGLDIKATDKDIAEYISKYGHLPQGETWDSALELTKATSKESDKSIHPFKILELSDSPDIPAKDRAKYKALWYEYANAFSGKAQIFWTDGLKAMLLVDEDETDDDSAERSTVAYCLNFDAWRAVLYMGKRAELLNEAIKTKGDFKQLKDYVYKVVNEANYKRKRDEYLGRFYEKVPDS